VATCPEICLAADRVPAHVLGQGQAMVALALKSDGSGLNALGQSLPRALAQRVPGQLVLIRTDDLPDPFGSVLYARR
jgi:hypothetical protein